jgi:hypothetical protein
VCMATKSEKRRNDKMSHYTPSTLVVWSTDGFAQRTICPISSSTKDSRSAGDMPSSAADRWSLLLMIALLLLDNGG